MALRAYRELLGTPGAVRFVSAGFVGRLPMSMRSLGCLLMISIQTDSYGLAGVVTAALTLAQAVAAPALGRAADQVGQRIVIAVSVFVHAFGMVALVLLASRSAPAWTLIGSAVLVGASALPLGPLVRARWTVLVDSARLPTAYAFESILDEVVYVAGPMLVTALAVGWFPAAGLLCSLALTVLGSLALAVQRRTEPPRAPQQRRASAVRALGMGVLLTIYAGLGVFLGAVDVAVVSFSSERGATGAAGVLLALFAVGSLVAGLVYGSVPIGRITSLQRLVGSAAALCVVAVPMVFADTVPVLAVGVVLAGVAVSPILISGSSLAASLVPRAALTEGFAWLSSAVAVGLAAGAAVGGQAVDATDSTTAFLLAVVGGVIGALAAVLGRHRLRPRSAPVPGASPVVAATVSTSFHSTDRP